MSSTDPRSQFYNNYVTAQLRYESLEEARTRIATEQHAFENFFTGLLPRDEEARILDLGCGCGAFVDFVRKRRYKNVRGVDVSPEQVALGNELGISIEQGNLFDVIAEESNVELVALLDVIEHLTRSEAIEALQQIYNALKPGGYLVVRTPNVDGINGTTYSFGDLTHELHLNYHSALELFALVPFAHVRVLPVFPVGGSLVVRVLRTILRPFYTVTARMRHVVAGTSSSSALTTPNMLVIAQR